MGNQIANVADDKNITRVRRGKSIGSHARIRAGYQHGIGLLGERQLRKRGTGGRG